MPPNSQRREAVMERSIKLGHCVCNPKVPCPCPTFREYNVCTCAGEKLPAKETRIALTHYVKKAGCASKIGQADLNRILSALPPVADPNVLIGVAAGDDAGVYRLNDRLHLVQTVDVFTPCVDDGYLFGQIAAANSLSDIYAMGGTPITALSIIGYPIDELDGSIMEAILRGGMDKLREAGCSLIGGHSINDEEIKCGFAVTGLINRKRIVSRDGARPGDALVLTKPLGTGIICFAAQIGRLDEATLTEVGASMATLNRDAAELMLKHKAHACTDVTGFGLIGHLVEMIRGSGVSAEIAMSKIPVFAAVKACLENDMLPGAIESNQEYSSAWVKVKDMAGKDKLPLLYDPQTSGGLLIALPKQRAGAFIEEMHTRGHIAASIIGRVVEKDTTRAESEIIITDSRLERFIGDPSAVILLTKEESMKSSRTSKIPSAGRKVESASESLVEDPASGADSSCCTTPPDSSLAHEHAAHSAARASDASELVSAQFKELFAEFLKEVSKEGLIDKRAKKLMAIALSISQHCKPCLSAHIKGALSMGIGKAEIDEAVYLAISFAGAPALMLYNEVCKELGV